VKLFERHGVFSETELRARRDILLESYCKQNKIEANVMTEMVRREILPAVLSFQKQLADTVLSKRAVAPSICCEPENSLLNRVSGLTAEMDRLCSELEEAASGIAIKGVDPAGSAVYCRDTVLPAAGRLREVTDTLETIVSKELWPYPSYGSLLYRV